MNDRCLRHHRTSINHPDLISFNFVREKRVVVCIVGKSASVSWIRIMLQLTGNTKAMKIASGTRGMVSGQYKSYITRMENVGLQKRLQYLLKSYKIIVVRDPLVRLISAYRHIILILKVKVQQIKRVCRPNVSERLTGVCISVL